MTVLLAALLVAGAVLGAAVLIARSIQRSRAEGLRPRALTLFAILAPAIGTAERDPRAMLVWQGLAGTARQMFPEEFALLDRAAGGTFPFGRERLEAAHAHWTAEWLAWERAHDAEYKLKAAIVEEEIAASGTSAVLRARLDVVEREKLELYQRRYGEYVRVAKALQALVT